MLKKNKLRKILYILSFIFIVSGLILSIYGFSSGATLHLSHKQYKFFNMFQWDDKGQDDNFTFNAKNEVTSIEIKSTDSDIELRYGNEFLIEAYNLDKHKITFEEIDGKAILNDHNSFNFSINIGSFGNQGNTSKLVITIPKSCDSINAQTATGDIQALDLSISTITLQSNLGDIELQQIFTKKLFVKTNAGDIEFKGDFENSIELKSNLGDIDASLTSDKSSYDFILKTNIGDIDFYDSNRGTTYDKYNGKNRLLDAKTNIGDIEIE